MILANFAISLFLYKKKRKTKEKEKVLHRLGPAHDEAGCKDSTQVGKKKPTRRGPLGSGHFASGTLMYFTNY
jgi:hypothetical protein